MKASPNNSELSEKSKEKCSKYKQIVCSDNGEKDESVKNDQWLSVTLY